MHLDPFPEVECDSLKIFRSTLEQWFARNIVGISLGCGRHEVYNTGGVSDGCGGTCGVVRVFHTYSQIINMELFG